MSKYSGLSPGAAMLHVAAVFRSIDAGTPGVTDLKSLDLSGSSRQLQVDELEHCGKWVRRDGKLYISDAPLITELMRLEVSVRDARQVCAARGLHVAVDESGLCDRCWEPILHEM